MSLSKLRTPKDLVAYFTATFFGSGLFPKFPGTMGSLTALPLVYLVNLADAPARLAFWFFVLLIGVWAARHFDTLLGTTDNQAIVIDEALGMAIAAWTATTDWKALLVAFVFFRIFDIIKPFPVRQIDRWSKKQSSYLRSFGVMADDVIAGLQALLVVVILQALGALS